MSQIARWWIGGFLLFVAVATGFLHSGLYLLVMIVRVVLVIYLLRRTGRRYVWWLLLVPGIVRCAVYMYIWRYAAVDEVSSGAIQGTITARLRGNRYILESISGNRYIVRMSDNLDRDGLDLGDTGMFVGSLSSVDEQIFAPFFSSPSWSLDRLIVPEVVYGTFDYDRRLVMKGYQGTLFVQSIGPLERGELGAIDRMRQRFLARVETIYPQNQVSSLIAGLLVGDISGMQEDDYQAFIDAGLVHIVAVSGSNMMMLLVFLHVVLFFLPYYMRIGVIAVGLVVYGMICGLDSSVLRAMVMGVLTLVALLMGKATDIHRIIGVALIVMLLRNPFMLLYDLGFALSFMALYGIIRSHQMLVPRLQTLSRWVRRGVLGYILPTLGASLGVLPVLVFWIGTTNVFTLLANILVLPLLPVIMLSSLLSLIWPWGRMTQLVSSLLGYVYTLTHWSAAQGVFIGVDNVWAKYAIVAVLLLLYRSLYHRGGTWITRHYAPKS